MCPGDGWLLAGCLISRYNKALLLSGVVSPNMGRYYHEHWDWRPEPRWTVERANSLVTPLQLYDDCRQLVWRLGLLSGHFGDNA